MKMKRVLCLLMSLVMLFSCTVTFAEETQTAPVVETEVPVLTEETVAAEEPVVIEEPVVEETVVTEEPVVVTEAPVVVTEEPVVVTEAPVVVTEEPVVVTEEPVVVTEAPVVTEEPVVVTEAPVVTEEPVVVTEAPVVTEEPVVVTEAPVVTEVPVVEETFVPGYASYGAQTKIFGSKTLTGECVTLSQRGVVYVYEKVNDEAYAVYYVLDGSLKRGYVKTEGNVLSASEVNAYNAAAGVDAVKVPNTAEYVLAAVAIVVETPVVTEAPVVVSQAVGNVNKAAVQIVVQPETAVAAVGDTVSFTVQATGVAAYQWQYSNNGGVNWNNSSAASATTATLSGYAVNEARLSYKFRCKLTGENGEVVYTNAVGISEKTTASALVINKQPETAKAQIGDTVSFTVQATGVAGYQWQFSKDNGANWNNSSAPSAKTATLSDYEVNSGRLSYLFRCQLTGTDGTVVYTKAVGISTETSSSALTITKQPVTAEAQVGDTVSFTVVATGVASYQWQYSNNNGANWNNSSSASATTATLSGYAVNEARMSYKFRCKLTGTDGTIKYTDVVGISAKPSASSITITKQPVTAEAQVGDTVSFTVVATGVASYQWQYSNNNGANWNNSSSASATTATLSGYAVTEARMSYKFRCKLTGTDGTIKYTDVVGIFAKPSASSMAITKQPVTAEGAIGEFVSFSVEATGVASYQWQFSNNNGVNWNDSSSDSAKTATMSGYEVKESRLGYKFRCKLTGTDGSVVYTDVVGITLKESAPASIEITKQPETAEGAIGEFVSFSVEATGVASYQWQFSNNNGANWNDSSSASAQTATMSGYEVKESRLGYKFRCKLTGTDGSVVYTDVVGITLKETEGAPATIVKQPETAIAKIGETVSFTVEATNVASYQWQFSNNNGVNWNDSSSASAKTATMSGYAVTEARLAYQFRCKLTGTDGSVIYTDVVGISTGVQEPSVTIIKQPETAEAAIGDFISFSVEATGVASYQWQYSNNKGTSWNNSGAASAKTATLTDYEVKESRLAYLFRCQLTGEDGSVVYTDVVGISAIVVEEDFEIIAQPVDVVAGVGSVASFSVEATGVASYQWQFSKDEGKTWINSGAATATTSTLSGYEVNEARMAYKFRCQLTGVDGTVLYTDVVGFVSDAPVIVKQPEDIMVLVGDVVSFTVEATGAAAYQWQYSRNNGTTWDNSGAASAKTATLTDYEVTEGRMGYLFRCQLTGEAGTVVYTDVVKFIKQNFVYEIKNDEVTILGYVGDEADVVVPEIIKDCTVTAIAESAFEGNEDITSVTLPNAVTYIGSYAFRNCSKLASVNYPTAWAEAGENGEIFKGTKMTSMTVPSGVTEIPAYAFMGCDNFTSFTLANTVQTIGKAAFKNCTNLATMNSK